LNKNEEKVLDGENVDKLAEKFEVVEQTEDINVQNVSKERIIQKIPAKNNSNLTKEEEIRN
jgi:hypothetical protein